MPRLRLTRDDVLKPAHGRNGDDAIFSLARRDINIDGLVQLGKWDRARCGWGWRILQRPQKWRRRNEHHGGGGHGARLRSAVTHGDVAACWSAAIELVILPQMPPWRFHHHCCPSAGARRPSRDHSRDAISQG